MVKWVLVKLTDREYQILENLDDLTGDSASRLKELFTRHLLETPKFKVDYHVLKLDENKEHLSKVLQAVWNEYELSPEPMDGWDMEKFDRINKELIQINAIRPMGGNKFAPTYMFKKPWLAVYNSVPKIFPELDEFSQAYVATIYMLDYLSRETLGEEMLKDSTIILNELFMLSYAAAKKRAHEFTKALKFSSSASDLASNDLAA